MNKELQEWCDSLIKGACFHCEDVTFKNIELEKEVKALRLILQSHGEIIEMNAKLREENARLREQIEKLQGLISTHIDHCTIKSYKELCDAMGHEWRGE